MSVSRTATLSSRPNSTTRLNKLRLIVLQTLVVMTALAVMTGVAQARPAPNGFADLAEKLLPSVVNISTSAEVKSPFGEDENGEPALPPGIPDFFRDFFENQKPRKSRSMGSGFIISVDGLVITNNHVVDDADEVIVTLSDGAEFEAEVVGTDQRTDLALLRVKTERNLPPVKLGNSDELRVGEWVIAIGNPYGLGGTVTAGIVSALGRDINAGPYDDFIQTDAPINQGNSGGPLFNMDGEVVGVNSVIISRSGGNVGIGFSIPASMVQRVVDDLLKHGIVKRGWLGVGIQPVDEQIAESLGLGEPRGALISNVMEGDPADRAGLRSGDVILQFGGVKITDTRDVLRAVADTAPGTKVNVTVWRDGDRKALRVEVGEMPEDVSRGPRPPSPEEGEEPDETTFDALGLTLTPLTDMARERLNLDEDVTGVVVAQVRRGGAAQEKGIRRGDLVVRVGETVVDSLRDVREAVDEAKDAGKPSVLVRIRRGDNYLFVGLPVNEDE